MANDSRILDTISVGTENLEENELILELSIGGIFEKSKRNLSESVEKELNVQSKRENQALRRRELRRKREEKMKKSVGFGSCGSVNGPFVDNNEWLETQIVRQNDENLEIEPALKKEKIGNLPENVGSSSRVPVTNGFVNQKVIQVSGGQSFRACEGNMNVKGIEDENEGGGRRNAAGYASSAFSDSQCSSRQGGGVTDDSRSNSSNSQLASTRIDQYDPSEQPTDSCKQTISTLSEPSLVKQVDQLHPNPHASSVSNPPSKPETSNQLQQASFLARMPCVSTTGNGPNGKTVSGFLYRYTKNEVSIICVCHGQSFTPAGFVEHAGGVDIIHPLKHITIFPTALS